MYGGLIGTHQRSFELYHPRPPMASPFSTLGVCNLATPLISGTGKAMDFKFGGYIYMAIPNKSPLKILEKMEPGRIQELSKFFGYPLLSRERVKLRTSHLARTFTGPIRIKAHKHFEEKRAWAYPGAAHFLGTPIISGTGKATDFTFCRNIHRIDGNKSP